MCKLDMLSELSKDDRKTDIPYLTGCARDSILKIQEILEAD